MATRRTCGSGASWGTFPSAAPLTVTISSCIGLHQNVALNLPSGQVYTIKFGKSAGIATVLASVNGIWCTYTYIKYLNSCHLNKKTFSVSFLCLHLSELRKRDVMSTCAPLYLPSQLRCLWARREYSLMHLVHVEDARTIDWKGIWIANRLKADRPRSSSFGLNKQMRVHLY